MKIIKIPATSQAFPHALRHIPQPPGQLYVLGNTKALMKQPLLAIVGSRKVTPYGRSITRELTQAVAGQGIGIVSGLALGVDAIAHQAALDAGGLTIAVLACGLDKIYPATHRHLAEQILQKGGAIVSEYEPGTPPLQFRFIERNRLVSGMSDGLLVTEATAKSGTIHTAGFALDQGKTVMAVPGNITSELSRGTNNLIRSGAAPITSGQDILDALGISRQLEITEVLAASAEEHAILTLLKQGITDGGELQLMSRLDPRQFNQTLTMLEITGKVYPSGAGQWSLA